MPNDMVTGGNRAPQVEFLSSVLLVLWMCITVFAWFAPSSMDCRVFFRLSLLGAYRFTVFRAHLWQKLHTKVVFKHFDRDSYVLYIHISYIYISYIYISYMIIFRISYSPWNCHEKSHVARSMALIKPFTVLVAPSTCPIFMAEGKVISHTGWGAMMGIWWKYCYKL